MEDMAREKLVYAKPMAIGFDSGILVGGNAADNYDQDRSYNILFRSYDGTSMVV